MTYRLLQCSEAWAIHFTENAGRLGLLQITLSEKNPKLLRDCQPTPELMVLLFLYAGIIHGTREVGTWTHLLCFTWQRTKARSLLVCIPVIMETPPWQVLQNHDKTWPKVCNVNIYVLGKREREVQRKWTDLCMIKQYVGNLGVGRVRDPWTSLLRCTSHSQSTSQCTHPNQGGIPWAHTGRTDLLQRGHQLWYICKRLFKVRSISILMCRKKIWILFLVRGWIVHLSWTRLHQYNTLSIQKLSQRTWRPDATTKLNWT